MAKKQVEEKKVWEDHHGTKTEMVVEELDVSAGEYCKDGQGNRATGKAVIAEDGNGKYYTSSEYVGNGILDPYREYRRVAVEA